jgi:hypothetical protein
MAVLSRKLKYSRTNVYAPFSIRGTSCPWTWSEILKPLLMKKGIQASDLGRLNLEDKIFIQDSLGFNGWTQYPNPLNPSIKDKTDNVNLIGCQVKYADSPPYGVEKNDWILYKSKMHFGILQATNLTVRSGFKTSDQVQGPRCSGITYLNLKKLMYASSADRSRKSLFSAFMGYMSIYRRLCCTLLYKIRCESRASGATHKDYKIRREIPQHGTTQPLGLRWGFETTSNQSRQRVFRFLAGIKILC